jgi:hypothetical protein
MSSACQLSIIFWHHYLHVVQEDAIQDQQAPTGVASPFALLFTDRLQDSMAEAWAQL